MFWYLKHFLCGRIGCTLLWTIFLRAKKVKLVSSWIWNFSGWHLWTWPFESERSTKLKVTMPLTKSVFYQMGNKSLFMRINSQCLSFSKFECVALFVLHKIMFVLPKYLSTWNFSANFSANDFFSPKKIFASATKLQALEALNFRQVRKYFVTWHPSFIGSSYFAMSNAQHIQ